MFGNTLPVYGWLTQQMYGYNPFVGFLVTFNLTVVAVSGLQWLWDGRVVPLRSQFLGFLIGDTLLAVIVALATRITQRDPATTTHSATYWAWWAIGGLIAAVGFIAGEFAQRKLTTLRDLYTSPVLVYHHVGLFGLLVPVLAGVVLPLLWPHRGDWEAKAIVVLFVAYLALNIYDAVHPPQPAPVAPGSIAAQLTRAAV